MFFLIRLNTDILMGIEFAPITITRAVSASRPIDNNSDKRRSKFSLLIEKLEKKTKQTFKTVFYFQTQTKHPLLLQIQKHTTLKSLEVYLLLKTVKINLQKVPLCYQVFKSNCRGQQKYPRQYWLPNRSRNNLKCMLSKITFWCN